LLGPLLSGAYFFFAGFAFFGFAFFPLLQGLT
jgi:hypothetical protein